jgi:hypothetical protein
MALADTLKTINSRASNAPAAVSATMEEREQQLRIDQQRASAKLAQQQKEEEDQPGLFGKIASGAVNLVEKMWTDDFSAIPVVGPVARVTGETLQTAWDGSYALGSSAALAANPRYWENRGPTGDLFADARKTNVGDAFQAAGEFVSSTPLGKPLIGGKQNIYDKNPSLNIANRAQRDAAFSDRPDLEIASGVVSGAFGWFFDPLVIVGKGAKVARFGTTAFGMDVVGLSQRKIRDQRGFSQKVLESVDSDADSALEFARTGLGQQSRIGVIGQQIADRDYESLKRLNAFQGANRDTLASIGAGIDNTEDAIIYLAAASGSAKYQKILAETQASVDLALKRASSGGLYETAALNIPIGAPQPTVLKNFLEPGTDVAKVVEDLTKRDKALRAALLGVDESPTGMVEQLGGSSVEGMKIAAAWRDGVMARRMNFKGEMRNAAVTERISPRYGTGPSVYQKIYQVSGAMPRVAVLDWIKGSHATGWIDIRGFNTGKASDELEAVFSDTRTLGKDREWVVSQLDLYGQAQGPTQKFAAIKKIEQNAFEYLAKENGLDNPDLIREMYGRIDKARAETVAAFTNAAYAVDPADGTTMVMTAMMKSQLETNMPMLSMRMMEKSAKLVAQKAAYMDAKVNTSSNVFKTVVDEVMSLWKAGVLLRLGYTIRNTTEGWARSAVYLGTIPGMTQLGKTAGRSLFNNKQRIVSRAPGVGTKALIKRETEASNQLNLLTDDVTKLREKIAADPNGSSYDVSAVASELGAKEKSMRELQESLDKLAVRRAELGARRFYGDDGAFGGPLNAEYADLYRRMSSSESTNSQFLQSRYMRSRSEVLAQNNWGRVKSTDPQYWNELFVSARQFRGDDIAKRLLNGEDTGSIVAWAKSSEGRLYRRDMNISKEGIEERVVFLDDMIKSYLPTDTARRLAAREDVTPEQLRSALGAFSRNKAPSQPKITINMDAKKIEAKRAKYEKDLAAWKQRQQGVPVLSDIHGRQVQDAIRGNAYQRFVDRPIEKIFSVLGTYPESTLVRHPFYNEVWTRTFNQLTQIAKIQGREIDDVLLKKINTSAHTSAMRATNETLFTIERYSNPAAAMRWAAPFFAAWENSAKVWTKLVVNDPSVLARANMLWNIPANLGMIVDAEGNKVEGGAFDFLKGSKDQYITLPAGLDEVVAKATGGTHIRIPRASLNVVTPGETPWLPGFGPVVTMGVGMFLSGKPDLQGDLRKILGDNVYQQIAPFGEVDNNLLDTFAPTWFRNEYVRWQGENNEDYLRTANAMMQIAMVDWYKAGGLPEDKPDMDKVYQMTNDFYRFTSVARLTLPVTTSRSSPYQFEVDEWNKLKNDPQYTWSEKVDKFLDTYGDEFTPLTVSGSDNLPGVQPTQEVYALLRDHGDLARELAADGPDSVGILASSAPLGEFDQGVYKWLGENNAPGLDEAFRGARQPGDMSDQIVMSKAWREYRAAKTSRDEAMKQLGITSLNSNAGAGIKAYWDNFVDNTMREKYGDVWTVEFNSFEQKTPGYLVGITKALNNKSFMNEVAETPRWQGISTYMATRQAALQAISQGADSSNVKDVFAAWIAEYRYSSLEFNDFYERFLDQDELNDYGDGIGAVNGSATAV